MKIVIVGGGKVGFAIAREVSAEGHDVTIIDSSRAVCDRLSLALDGMTVQGHRARIYEKFRVHTARELKLLYDDIRACMEESENAI